MDRRRTCICPCAPLRLRASPAAVVGVHELGIVDGFFGFGFALAVVVVVCVLPIGFPWGFPPEAFRVVDAREYLVEKRVVGPPADAAGCREGGGRRQTTVSR